jgi:hypothetical protein
MTASGGASSPTSNSWRTYHIRMTYVTWRYCKLLNCAKCFVLFLSCDNLVWARRVRCWWFRKRDATDVVSDNYRPAPVTRPRIFRNEMPLQINFTFTYNKAWRSEGNFPPLPSDTNNTSGLRCKLQINCNDTSTRTQINTWVSSSYVYEEGWAYALQKTLESTYGVQDLPYVGQQ